MVLCLTAVALLVVSALRFVPRLNDALSGKAEYVRILTETFGRQFATQTQMQFPVIVEQDEHGTCQAVSAPSIAEEEIRGTIYLLTYSEQQNLTCITTYVVPMDASGSQPYAASGRLKERTTVQHFSARSRRLRKTALSTCMLLNIEKTPLAIHAALPSVAQRGSEPEKPILLFRRHATRGSVSIDFDYGELRAEIAKRHQIVNFGLSVLLIGCVAVFTLLLQNWRWPSGRYRSTAVFINCN